VDRTKGFHRTLNTGFHAGFLGDVDLLRDGSIAKAALQNLQALVIAIERSDADACLRQGQTLAPDPMLLRSPRRPSDPAAYRSPLRFRFNLNAPEW
jgi:hypothetical protein